MKVSLQSFAAFASYLAFARSHQIPSNNKGVGIIDAHFDTDLFSTISGKKFEFKSLFDFDSGVLGDNIDTITIKSKDDDGNSNSTFNNDQGFASPSNLLLLRDHTIDQLLSPNTLPCRFQTRNGEKINDLKELKSMYVNRRRRLISSSSLSNSCILHQSPDNTACSNNGAVEQNIDEYEELHLYAVPNGQVFIYTPSFYAKCSKNYQKFSLPHIK